MAFTREYIAAALGLRRDASLPQLNAVHTQKLAEYEKRDQQLETQQKMLAIKIRSIPSTGPSVPLRKRYVQRMQQLQSQRQALSNLIMTLQSYQHALEMLQITNEGVHAMKQSTSMLTMVQIPDIKQVELLTEENHELMDKIKEVSDQVAEPFNMDCLDPVEAADDDDVNSYLDSLGLGEDQMGDVEHQALVQPVTSLSSPMLLPSMQVQSPHQRFQSLTESQLSQLPSVPMSAPSSQPVDAPAQSASSNPFRRAMQLK